MPQVTIRPIDLDKDAKRLADMWNASDLEWPGSWTRGIPMTEERVREIQAERRFLVTFVAEVDGEIAGYCSFTEGHMGREGEGYLALLNVQPKFQQLSIGRKLIQATIERSVEMGWKRQTLGTWQSNFKAVRTYKKTGHFWQPDTWVLMDNFIPGALQMPLAKPFFARHDWYSCYVRELRHGEDDERWEGLKVYTQHWEAGGEALTIWIDRQARAPVAIETNDLFVATIPEDIEPLAGSKVAVHWRTRNKGREPLLIYLHAIGDAGLSIDYRDVWIVPPGETVERVAQVQVAENAPYNKDDGTAPAVRSILGINEQEVELFCGLCARKRLSLDTAAPATLTPGVPKTIGLQVHSELAQPAKVTLCTTPPHGLAADWTRREIEVPARGHVTVPLTVTLADEGVYTLPLRAEFEDGALGRPVSETLKIFALRAGGLVAQREGDSVRVETDALRFFISAHEGQVRIEHKLLNQMLASFSVTLGPPYSPSPFQKMTFELDMEQRGSRVVVRMSGGARHDPDLWLHQELVISAVGLATYSHVIENRGSQIRSTHLRLNFQVADRDRAWMTFPLQSGMVHSLAADFPSAQGEAPNDVADYVEPWIAWERDGMVAGLAWDASAAKVEMLWNAYVQTKELRVPPGERSQAAHLAFYADVGDWRAVRRTLLRWAGSSDAWEQTAETRPVAMARLEPGLLVTTSREVSGRLIVDTASARQTGGQVAVAVEGGILAKPARAQIADLVRGKPFERDIRLALPEDALGVFKGQVRLVLPLCDQSQPFHIVRLGTEGEVAVREEGLSGHQVWAMDNGMSRFIVAPGFGPSLIAWQERGINHVYSPFPEPQSFSWIYPWHGGVGPLLSFTGWMNWAGFLYRERFAAQPIRQVDRGGLMWQGVRLSAQPTKREFADLIIEVDYLTLAGSRALKYVYRLRNLRGTAQVVRTGSVAAFRLGGEAAELSLHGAHTAHRPTPWSFTVAGQRWGALTHERTGKAVVMVGRQNDIVLADAGRHGRILGAMGDVHLAGNEVRELAYYLVLCDSLAQAREYAVLQDY